VCWLSAKCNMNSAACKMFVGPALNATWTTVHAACKMFVGSALYATCTVLHVKCVSAQC